MIFVALGTQKQSMHRLIEYLADRKEEIVIQNGHTVVSYQHMKSLGFITYGEMEKWIKKADLVITHGGGGTIFLALRHHKKVIVVPRLKKYREHINDHQVEFSNYLDDRKYVLTAYSKDDLNYKIDHFCEYSIVDYEPHEMDYIDYMNSEIETLLFREM